MAHSLEVRPPFLDHRLVEFSAKIPGKYKINRGVHKSVLKNAVKDLLPKEVIHRPKEGFVLPLNQWFVSALSDILDQAFDPAYLKKQGLFEPSLIAQRLKEHRAGTHNHGQQLWVLLSFQKWWQMHFGEGYVF